MCAKTRLTRLTPREHEVLAWLSSGKTNNMIAQDLGISGGTVKIHVRSILRKLKISSRMEAAIIAVKHGIYQPDRIG
ncbi:MAG: response regulator transcription factor [Thiolinea sp.]